MRSIENLETYIFMEYIKGLIRKNGTQRYVLKVELEQLDLSRKGKLFVLQILEKRNIIILSRVPYKIDDREFIEIDTIWKESLLEEIEDEDLRESEPILSKLEYSEAGELIYEDYSKLDYFLDNILIPRYTKIKKHYEKKSYLKENQEQSSYFSISLTHIMQLPLNEEEFRHVMEYLKQEGIRVGGNDVSLTGEFDNYDYIHDASLIPILRDVSEEVKNKKIEEYQREPNLDLRNEIVLLHLEIVESVAYKYSLHTGFKMSELMSYGYEGLIYAVEKFNYDLNKEFFSYAYTVVKSFILRGIALLSGIYNRDINFYWEYFRYKKIVEEEYQVHLEESPEFVIQKVVELLARDGKILKKKQQEHCNLLFLELTELLIDDYEISDNDFLEKGIYYRDSLVEKEVLKKSLKEDLDSLLLETLDNRERDIIEKRFELHGNDCVNLEDLGKIHHVSVEGVRFIQKKALVKMRSKKIRDYLDL